MGMNWLRSGLLVSIAISAVAQVKTAPADLVQYVRSAKNEGMPDRQAQQLAIRAGWPAIAVTDAIAEVYGTTKQPSTDGPKGAEFSPSETQPSAHQPSARIETSPN